MKKFALLIIVFSFAIAAYAQTTAEVLSELNKLNSYTADFIQKTEIEGFGSDTYSGKMYIKSRAKALWDYQKPYRQFYLFDKTTMQFYDSESKQLLKQQLDPSSNAYMRLMLNPSDIKKDFTASYNPTTSKLALAPTNKASGINAIIFTIKDGMITGIQTKDQNGNNTSIMLTNIKINPEISDGVFSPVVPAGTEVFNR